MRFLSPLLSILLVPVVAGTSLLAQIPAPIPPPGPSSDSGDAPSLQLRVLNPTSAAGDFIVEVTDMAGAPVSNAAVVFRLPDDDSSTFADSSRAAVTYTDAGGRGRVNGVRWSSTAAPITVRITAAKGTAHAGILFEHAPPGQSPAPLPAPVVTSAPANLPQGPIPAPIRLPAQPSAPGISIDTNVPLRNFTSTGASIGDVPGISITSAGPASGSHFKTKWLLILGAAAAGGAALALVHKGGSTTSSSSGSGITLGPPTVSVGHP